MTGRRKGTAAALGLLAVLALARNGRADDGYRLWLRYDLLADPAQRQSAAAAVTEIALAESSPTLDAARAELAEGLGGLLGQAMPVMAKADRAQACVLGRATDPAFDVIPPIRAT